MNRHRYRFVFRKESDARWLGHRDLLRTLERALRRANLRLSMTQGFHPKPRFSFPLALALGLEGHAEWMEIELQDELPAEEVRQRLQAELPEGLILSCCWRLEPRAPKMAVERVVYRVTIPREDCSRIERIIGECAKLGQAGACASAELFDGPADCPTYQTTLPPLPGSSQLSQQPGIDRDAVSFCREHFSELWLHEDQLYLEQQSGQAGIGPRQLLAALGLPNLERQGHVIARVAIHLHDVTDADEWTRPPLPNEYKPARR